MLFSIRLAPRSPRRASRSSTTRPEWCAHCAPTGPANTSLPASIRARTRFGLKPTGSRALRSRASWSAWEPTVRADITLQIEETRTEIDVAASLIDPSQSTSANIVNGTAIRDLPINGRRFQDFALLTPTVQVDRQRGQLSFVGQRGINSNVMVDGTDYNQPFFGGIRGGERSNHVITVPQSAIREFQAVSAGYTAEYGRSSGGMLNVITKGRNQQAARRRIPPSPAAEAWEPRTPSERRCSRHSDSPAVRWGGRSSGTRLSSSSLSNVSLPTLPGKWSFRALRGRRANRARRRSISTRAWRNPSSLRTTPGHSRQERTCISAVRRPLTFRYNASSADALNTSTTGNPRQSRTNRALSNNGTEKNQIHYFTGQLTSLWTPAWTNELRVTASGEERPRLNNASIPLIQSTIGTLRRPQLPSNDPARLQGPDIRFRLVDERIPHRQARSRLQPADRQPELRLPPVRPVHPLRLRCRPAPGLACPPGGKSQIGSTAPVSICARSGTSTPPCSRASSRYSRSTAGASLRGSRSTTASDGKRRTTPTPKRPMPTWSRACETQVSRSGAPTLQ